MKRKWIKVTAATIGMAVAPSIFAATDTATTTLGVTVAPEASISVTASPTLSKGGTEFESFTGNTTFNYKVRTTTTGGAGTVTALVTTAFAGASGITTADLTHIASTAGVGTANTSSTVADESSATNILTFATDVHSADAGDAGAIAWTLADRPVYKTGTYSTVVTLTISAT
ncbi:MAG: hypothetical protein ACKV2U_10600 [Bryobacteraceae bacterium]